MAELLYRIGRFSVRRAWLVLLGWLGVLALAGGAFLAFGGTLTQSMSIPGTETERVTEQLDARLDGLGGATGTVVFQTDDGEALSDAQREEISALLADIAEIDGVSSVVDPFTTTAARDDQAAQLADGAAQIEAGRAELEAGQTQLDAARAQLDAGQAQLDAAIEQAKAAGAYEQAAAQFEAQQAQLDAGAAELDAQQAQLDAGAEKLDASAAELEDGTRLMDAAAEIRTVSTDETTVIGAVMFEDDLFSLSSELKAEVAGELDGADIDGVNVDYSSEIAASIDGLIGIGEIVGVLIAALVLIIVFRALLPATLPIISSFIGVGIGVAGSLAFSGVVDMSSVTPVLGVMLGLAVGIDYALFIINRHRRQVLAGMELRESIQLANGTAGNAVVFAGSTVLVALLALNITGIPFLGIMGTVGAVCVLVAVLIAVTLTPALLGLIGVRVLSKRARAEIGHESHAAPKLVAMPTWRAIVTAVVSIVVLLVIAIPALSMRLGLPDGASESPDATTYQAYTAVSDAFGAGQNGPLLVTATLPDGVAEDEVVATQADLAEWLMGIDDVVAVAPAGVSDDRDFFAFQVVPSDGPSSESTEALVHELRGQSPIDDDAASDAGLDGVELGVAGGASGNIDISAKLAGVLPLYLAVVVGLSLIILILVFRSILVPLIATAGFVLSLFAAFGATVAIFQWGWFGEVFGVHNPGPVLNFAPIIVMGVLFGLAMDYQLFLVSGMREAYVHGTPARVAVVAGLRGGRAVVTAAAIIMAAVFGGFVFSHLTMVRPLGFGLAIGVLFDAFIVRMLLTPAIMHLLGPAAWWLPKWLDRLLPDVDVEGAALERSHPVHGTATTGEAAATDASTDESPAAATDEAAGLSADRGA
ncbi:RND superfamily putative drug exporter [Agromyces hippuratus]|uniref:RND superfamily putative drug exporter n=1 Tax=Agromyces hippuratus TaxID=286438 RepID=A0A852WXQ5_9MICO|nr:MMPL family transporter [Agromyces hippuratus]NYG22407.1 RND superfamily putative drug exporter [Agromyces hippuratus]